MMMADEGADAVKSCCKEISARSASEQDGKGLKGLRPQVPFWGPGQHHHLYNFAYPRLFRVIQARKGGKGGKVVCNPI
jgi:nucleoside-diphosphate-sugar epimerase